MTVSTAGESDHNAGNQRRIVQMMLVEVLAAAGIFFAVPEVDSYLERTKEGSA